MWWEDLMHTGGFVSLTQYSFIGILDISLIFIALQLDSDLLYSALLNAKQLEAFGIGHGSYFLSSRRP